MINLNLIDILLIINVLSCVIQINKKSIIKKDIIDMILFIILNCIVQMNKKFIYLMSI